jgi:predicted alpha/beta-hydrolase family hydrolase
MNALHMLRLIFLLLSAAGSIGGLPIGRWRRKRRAVSWPMAQATVISATVERQGPYYVVLAPYWFYAGGERYGGRMRSQYANEGLAKEVAARLPGTPINVRYKPGAPDRSVLEGD